jgi:hypothetical protein
MGVYSTMAITRQDALAEIMQRLQTASDEQVAAVLFDLTHHQRLFNYSIVPNYEGLDGWLHRYDQEVI